MIFIEQTASTQQYLKRLFLQKNVLDDIAIFTAYQSNGKGQFGKTWESEPYQNLLISFLLNPSTRGFLLPKDHFALTAITLLEVITAIENQLAFSQVLDIKWPNDLFKSRKKLGGVLVEVVKKNNDTRVVLGIGINIRQYIFSNLILQPTSLEAFAQQRLSISDIAFTLEKKIFSSLYFREDFLEEYKKRMAFRNEFCQVSIRGEKQMVKIIDVEKNGTLHLSNQEGKNVVIQHHQDLIWKL